MNDAFDIVEGDLLVRNGRIAAIGRIDAGERVDRTIDARGAFLLPGFIQTHIHLCQTIFRGYADDLALLDWLKTRIWPMEAAHTAASLAASARYAASELLHSGTTTILSMETVHDTDAVFDALEPTGLRAVVGKCMMDSDSAVPARLLEQTADSIDESVAIAKRWHGRANGRLARGICAALCDLVLARAARGGRASLARTRRRDPHARVREPRRGRTDQVAHRPVEHPLPRRHRTHLAAAVRGALRLGRRITSRRCSPIKT